MPTTLDQIMGMRLREIRERRGYTQRELAFALNVTSSLIRRWERGHTKLTAARNKQVARALRVHPKALLDVPGSPLKRQARKAARRVAL